MTVHKCIFYGIGSPTRRVGCGVGDRDGLAILLSFRRYEMRIDDRYIDITHKLDCFVLFLGACVIRQRFFFFFLLVSQFHFLDGS